MKLSKAESGKLGGMKSKQVTEEKLLIRINEYNLNPKLCKTCDGVLPYSKRHNLFCSRSCAVTKNNTLKKKKKNNSNTCLACNEKIEQRFKYCSIKCQHEFQYRSSITEWLNGVKVAGYAAIRRYLTETYGYKCVECGIDSYNGKPITLELEHKDGDSDNNKLENLCFLCPNCHSQTPTYKGRNKGKGRHSRRIRYASGKSY